MKNQQKAIVLGGTSPHIALIENLKNRGYYTVLVDYYENPPAKIVADEHIRESTLDQGKVLEIAKAINANLVISTCIDQANVIACHTAEKMGLSAPYSYEIALNVTNKGYMKKRMIEREIPTSKFILVDDSAKFEYCDLKFPVVVKPADTTGSKGVKKAYGLSELNEYLIEAIKLSRTNKAIIEEFNDGIEVQIDCFVQNKKAKLIMMRQKLKTLNSGKTVLQSIGSIIPAEITKGAQKKCEQIANQIIHAFNLDNTPLFIQAIVNGDNVNVIEFAPRIGGGLSYRMIKIITGFDILNATIDSYLNLQANVDFHQSESYYLTYIIYAQPGVFGSITGYHELSKERIIEEYYFFKTKGMEIGSDMASRNRVGAILVKADNKEELFRKTKVAIDNLEVLDIDGNSIMRKDLYPM